MSCKISRRSFLKVSGCLMLGSAVSGLVPARVIKPVTEAQIEANLRNAEHYVEHGKVHAQELKITAD